MGGVRPLDMLRAALDRRRQEVVSFCQELVRLPSVTGDEAKVADHVARRLRVFCDDVDVDAAGNVLAWLRGRGDGTLLFHSHMDVVPPGDAADWRYDPYSGEVVAGHIWGRGSADDKGSLAAQICALELLREAGLSPGCDVCLAAVVGEEIGGLGTRCLVEALSADLAIIGEPSGNALRCGHKGRVEFVVTMRGRSAHASMPDEGHNPHYAMARFLLALSTLDTPRDDLLGPQTVVPTTVTINPSGANVIPAKVSLHLDCRTLPGQNVARLQDQLTDLADEATGQEMHSEVAIHRQHLESYTGYGRQVAHAVTPFFMDADDPHMQSARTILQQALQRSVEVGVWPFYTDGGFLYAAGVPCIGFGPGQETMAHVADERLSVQELYEATLAYAALALAGDRFVVGSSVG